MNKYEVVLDVYSTGNFTKTAQHFNYSQSAVSQAVKAFEEELGFPIFKRTNAGVKLLPAAESVIRSLRVILKEEERLARISDAMTQAESGTVRLGLFFSFAVTYLPAMLKAFQATYPRVRFEIFTGNQDEIKEKLSQGEIDIAFTSGVSARGFYSREIIRDEFMAALPTDHPLTKTPALSIYDFNDLTYILAGEKFDFEIGAIVSAAGIVPSYTMEISDEMVALKLIEAGFGVGIFSKFFLDSIPGHAQVAIRPFKEHYYRALVIAMNEDYFIPAAAKNFFNFMADWLNQNLTKK